MTATIKYQVKAVKIYVSPVWQADYKHISQHFLNDLNHFSSNMKILVKISKW